MGITKRELVKIGAGIIVFSIAGSTDGIAGSNVSSTAFAPNQAPAIKTPFVPIIDLINNPELYYSHSSKGKIIKTTAFAELGEFAHHENIDVRNLALNLYGNKNGIRPSIDAENFWNNGIRVDRVNPELPEFELEGRVKLGMNNFYYFDISAFSKKDTDLKGRSEKSKDVVGFPSIYENEEIKIKGSILNRTIRKYKATRNFPFYTENELKKAEEQFKIFKPSEPIRRDLLEANMPNYILASESSNEIPKDEDLWFQGKVKSERKKFYYFNIMSGHKV